MKRIIVTAIVLSMLVFVSPFTSGISYAAHEGHNTEAVSDTKDNREWVKLKNEAIQHLNEAIKLLEESIKTGGNIHIKTSLKHAKSALEHAGHADEKGKK